MSQTIKKLDNLGFMSQIYTKVAAKQTFAATFFNRPCLMAQDLYYCLT